VDVDIFALLDELRAIARNGLHFATDPYDRERYQRLMALATRTYSELLDAPDEAVRARLWDELGYVTPKVGSDGAIFNQRGEILLMERVDSGRWCLPCGWVEPNERPVDTVVREVREETGLEVEVRRLVGLFTRMPSAENGPHTLVAVVHLCDVVGGELTLSHEGTDLRYWPIEKMEAWHADHERYARAAHAAWRSEDLLPAVSD
jgi:ADP-ribose pyrophosphatase YjhB (NUDIX family)